MLECNWTLMRTMLDAAFSDDVPPLARIDRFVDRFADRLTVMRETMGATPGCPLGGLIGELVGHGDQARTQATRVLNAWTQNFTDAISEAKGRGEVGSAVEAATVAVRLLAHLQGLALLAMAYDDPQVVLTAKQDFRLLAISS
ncbi:TetR family transcriptional regulator C-terminal domain-containing protein [Luedemannella flava]